MILYPFVRVVVAALCRVLFRVRVAGADRVPREGACVLAPSHRSLMDIFVLSVVTRRRLRFMAKVELFRIPVLGRLIRALGAFPVDRSAADRAALRAGAEVLADGEVLVVYPEGTRQNGPTITELRHGAAYLALRARAPIVPIGIGGSEEILPGGSWVPSFSRVAIVVGEPIPGRSATGPVKRSETTETSARLRVELQAVFDAANRLAGA